MPPAESEIMTLEEVAEYLRVSVRLVYDWAQKGDIPGGKIGGSWRFKRSLITGWVDRRLGGTPSPREQNQPTLAGALSAERCAFLENRTKAEVIDSMCALLSEAPEVTDPDDLRDAVYRRERLLSTGIGLGIGIPHVRLESVQNLVVCLAVVRPPLSDYESIDGRPVEIVAMIAAGAEQHAHHLRLVSELSRVLRDKSRRDGILSAASPKEMYSLVSSLGQSELAH